MRVNKALFAIFACVAIYGFTIGLSRPLLAIILESRGIDRTFIGLNAAMPAIGILLSALFIPRFVEKLGMQRFLVACLVIDLCVLLQFPRFDHLYAWFALSMVMGATTNCLLVASETWINEIVDDANRGRLMGLYNALIAATVASGPLVIPVTGIEGWTPFLIGALFIAISAIPLFWTGSYHLPVREQSSFNIFSFMFVAPTLVVAVLLFAWKETAGASLLPVYGIRSGLDEAGAATMLTILGLGGVCLSYPIGWCADKFDRYWILILCGAGALLGSLLLPYVINADILLWVMLFIWGGMFAGLYTIVLTLVGQRFRGMELVTANISIGVLWGVGSLTGPSITGIAMDLWDPQGFPIVFISASLFFVLFATGRWLSVKEKSVL